MASAFPLDPYTTSLMRGDTGAGRVWGLNLNLATPPPAHLVAAYERLATALTARLPGAGAYVYPSYALHITAASPAPFTNCDVAPTERPALRAAWAEALADARASDAWPAAPFPLVYARPTLEASAGIIWVDDPTGAVGRVRGCVAAAIAAHPALAGLADRLHARASPRIPNIIHTTVVRFGEPPDPDSPMADPAAVRAAFDAAVAEAWAPVTVMVDSLTLVDESAIYMHLHLGRGQPDEDKTVATFPFAPPRGGGGAAAVPEAPAQPANV